MLLGHKSTVCCMHFNFTKLACLLGTADNNRSKEEKQNELTIKWNTKSSFNKSTFVFCLVIYIFVRRGYCLSKTIFVNEFTGTEISNMFSCACFFFARMDNKRLTNFLQILQVYDGFFLFNFCILIGINHTHVTSTRMFSCFYWNNKLFYL